MHQLTAEKREIFGKNLKKPRGQGKMPAVLYGKGKDTASVFVDVKEFKKLWKEAGESTLIGIKNPESGKLENVLIQDVVLDPIKDEPIHADFYIVEMDKPITTKVALVYEGISPAEKDLGGFLVKVMHEIEVEALPKDLPHELKIDISGLANFGDQIVIKDIEMPEGVKVTAGENDVVVLVEEPKKQEVVEETPMSIEDIEVEKKGKKPAEGEEGEEEKSEARNPKSETNPKV